MGKVKNKSSDGFNCPHCLKHYIYKASFDSHIDKCSSVPAIKSNVVFKQSTTVKKAIKPKAFACSKCFKSFSGLKTLANHTDRCIGPASTHCNVDDPLDFANVYYGELESLFNVPPMDAMALPNYSNYLSELSAFHSNNNNLKLLHLNINSLFSKCFELNQILELENFDLIFLNETKLDENIPISFFSPTNYNVLRRDRDRKKKGGGVMVLVKKSLKLVSSNDVPGIEAIHLKINLNSVDVDFICCYNPNFNNRKVFIDFLELYLLSLDLNKPIFIVGDLNINLNSDNGVILTEFAKKYDFRNFVQEPTRVVKQSSTLIDVILHNSNFVHDTSVIGCPFSDHKFVACSLIVKPSSSLSVIREFVGRSYSQKNLASLKVEVDNRMHHLNKIKNVVDPNNKLKLLSSILNEAIDLCCPIKTFKFKPKDDFPWISHDLLVLKNRRDFLYSIWRDSKFDSDWLEYTAARRAWRTANRKAMIEYFKDKGISDFKNSKKFWQFYRASIRLKSDIPLSTCPSAIRDGDTILTSPDDISNSFNSFFTSIKSTSTVDVQEAKKRILKNFQELKLKLKFNKVFKFRKVTESEVEFHLSNMSSNCSPGHNGFHPKVLKVSRSLIPIITDIFNSCIELRIVPHDWKYAILTALFKKGDPMDRNNYRGISILPVLAKLFEKLLADQIMDYFVSNNFFFSGQHGFRKGHSCETALQELLSDINISRDQKRIILLLFIDFRKAFDTVDADLLIYKLGQYGFDFTSIELIESYFRDRQQVVKKMDPSQVNDCRPLPVTLGVPQGSCLGPLFFLIFINDLPFLLDLSSKLFADDTTLYLSGTDIAQLEKDFSVRSRVLLDWCNDNRIDINWSKTFAMFITNKRVQIPLEITIATVKVKVVDSFKLLGVTIDNKLSFVEYATILCRTVNKKLFSINRLFYLATSVKLQFFKSFILPYFDYCSSIFIFFPKLILQKLSNLYFLCLFKLFKFNFVNDWAAANEFLQKYGLQSFIHRIFVRFSSFSWRLFNLSSAPSDLSSQLKDSSPLSNDVVAPSTDSISLRTINCKTRSVSKVEVSNLKFGELTFGKFFRKFVNNVILINNLATNASSFRTLITSNDSFFNRFISNFLRFDLTIKNFDYLIKKT
jgi:hypothetical protein